MSFLQTLSVATDNSDDWTLVQDEFVRFSTKYGDKLSMVTISSILMGGESDEDEFLDENTMFKVLETIVDTALYISRADAMEIITALLNKGILFREKR